MATTTSATASLLSVSGLSSGIDTKTLIDQLIQVDRAPARIAEANKAKAQTRLDAIKTMNTRLLAARDALDAVKTTTNFAAKKASSSNETAVAVTATSSAIAGSLNISVKHLATSHQVATAGQTSATTPVAAGSLVFRLASTTSGSPDIVITPTTNTLSGLADAINATDQGLVASVVNDGSATPYRLVITSSKTGQANAITSMVGTGGFAAIVPDLSSLETVSEAQDAEVRVGNPTTGLKLTSSSNIMNQAIPGLSLTLKSEVDNIAVTVSQDPSSGLGSVQAMVDALNSANAYYASNSKYDVATKTSGTLFGDYDLRSRLDGLQRQLTQIFTSQPSGFQSLADVGVTIGDSNNLTINTTTFNAKLAENPSAVASLFSAATHAAYTTVDGLTNSVNGTMALKQGAIDSQIQTYADRITSIDNRLAQRRAFYESKFLAMEKITAQMKSQGNSLTSFIDGLNKK
jgi:flagellar hook-associated protein 2